MPALFRTDGPWPFRCANGNFYQHLLQHPPVTAGNYDFILLWTQWVFSDGLEGNMTADFQKIEAFSIPESGQWWDSIELDNPSASSVTLLPLPTAFPPVANSVNYVIPAHSTKCP